jgi:hypothetical protein
LTAPGLVVRIVDVYMAESFITLAIDEPALSPWELGIASLVIVVIVARGLRPPVCGGGPVNDNLNPDFQLTGGGGRR